MSFYIDATSLLDTFATTVVIYPQTSNDDGAWVDGQWVKKPAEPPLTVHEPLIPNSRVGLYSVSTLLRDSGKTAIYNAVWVSKQDYPLGTKVVNQNTTYTISDCEDLTNYSNVRLYYLRSEDAEQAKGEQNE